MHSNQAARGQRRPERKWIEPERTNNESNGRKANEGSPMTTTRKVIAAATMVPVWINGGGRKRRSADACPPDHSLCLLCATVGHGVPHQGARCAHEVLLHDPRRVQLEQGGYAWAGWSPRRRRSRRRARSYWSGGRCRPCWCDGTNWSSGCARSSRAGGPNRSERRFRSGGRGRSCWSSGPRGSRGSGRPNRPERRQWDPRCSGPPRRDRSAGPQG